MNLEKDYNEILYYFVDNFNALLKYSKNDQIVAF